jgi:hypothetical protein
LKHVTVRMAWHDSGWDGTICRNPAANSYCTGSHSLLSERLARNRCLKDEIGKEGKPLDAAMPAYLPPCYWTSCAFAPHQTKVVHKHPFESNGRTPFEVSNIDLWDLAYSPIECGDGILAITGCNIIPAMTTQRIGDINRD